MKWAGHVSQLGDTLRHVRWYVEALGASYSRRLRPLTQERHLAMIIDSSDTWGLRQMVTCVQPDRFACRMGDRELDSTDFRTGAHDSESIPNFRSRYHSECHSLSWPHSDHIRRTRGSDRRIVDRFPRSGPVTLNQGKNSRSWELSVPLLAAHPLCAVSRATPAGSALSARPRAPRPRQTQRLDQC